MEQASAKPDTKVKEPVSLQDMYFQILFFGLMLALVAMMTPFQDIILGHFGIFSNMTVIFAILGFGVGVKGILALNMENSGQWRILALLSVFSLFLAGEELGWGLSFITSDPEKWQIQSLQELIAVSLFFVPDDSPLAMTFVIAVIRLVFILGFVYAIIGLIFFRKFIMPIWQKFKEIPTYIYLRTMLILFLMSLPIRSGLIEEMAPLTAYTTMGISLSALMATFKMQPSPSSKE